MVVCSINDCGNRHEAKGYCSMHYARWKRTGDPLKHHIKPEKCVIDDCENKHYAKGWCNKHYKRWREHGDPLTCVIFTESCSIEGCKNKHQARGWCNKHYTRWLVNGDPLKTKWDDSITIDERLKNYNINQETGCWEWSFTKDANGYGMFKKNGKMIKAHRASYEFHFGKIPKGFYVCHRCDVPSCINPSHIFLGTPQDNMTDKTQKGRQAKGESTNINKLTEKDIIKIREMLNNGIKPLEISEIFNVHSSNIYSIKNYKTWKHVQPKREDIKCQIQF